MIENGIKCLCGGELFRNKFGINSNTISIFAKIISAQGLVCNKCGKEMPLTFRAGYILGCEATIQEFKRKAVTKENQDECIPQNTDSVQAGPCDKV